MAQQYPMKFSEFDSSSFPDKRVIVVEGREFVVSPSYLSMWSGYFRVLFNGDFKEAKEEKIELKDLKAEQFELFLDAVYPCRVPIKEDMASAMMSLADRFDSPHLFHFADDVMYDAVRNGRMSAFIPLSAANRHGVLDKCDRYLKTFPDLMAFMHSNEYDEITDDAVFTWVYKKFNEKRVSDYRKAMLSFCPRKRILFHVENVNQQVSVILTNPNNFVITVECSPNGDGLSCSPCGRFNILAHATSTLTIHHTAMSEYTPREDFISFSVQQRGVSVIHNDVLFVDYNK